MQKQQKDFHFIKIIASTSEVQKNDFILQKDYKRSVLWKQEVFLVLIFIIINIIVSFWRIIDLIYF